MRAILAVSATIVLVGSAHADEPAPTVPLQVPKATQLPSTQAGQLAVPSMVRPFDPPAAETCKQLDTGKFQGTVRVTCTVEVVSVVEGRLNDCRIVSEEPQGCGLGDATLKMTKLWKMKPQMINGTPVSGASWTTVVKWRIKP
jgi:protein TonB